MKSLAPGFFKLVVYPYSPVLLFGLLFGKLKHEGRQAQRAAKRF
jgi:hypothetical protein